MMPSDRDVRLPPLNQPAPPPPRQPLELLAHLNQLLQLQLPLLRFQLVPPPPRPEPAALATAAQLDHQVPLAMTADPVWIWKMVSLANLESQRNSTTTPRNSSPRTVPAQLLLVTREPLAPRDPQAPLAKTAQPVKTAKPVTMVSEVRLAKVVMPVRPDPRDPQVMTAQSSPPKTSQLVPPVPPAKKVATVPPVKPAKPETLDPTEPQVPLERLALLAKMELPEVLANLVPRVNPDPRALAHTAHRPELPQATRRDDVDMTLVITTIFTLLSTPLNTAGGG